MCQSLDQNHLICLNCGERIPDENITTEYEFMQKKRIDENFAQQQLNENNDDSSLNSEPQNSEDIYINDSVIDTTHSDNPIESQQLTENECNDILDHEQVLAISSKKTRPLNTFQFFLIQLLMFLPVANLIVLCVWAFKEKTNLNLKAFARASLIWFIIFDLLLLSLFITLILIRYPISLSQWFSDFKTYINSIDSI